MGHSNGGQGAWYLAARYPDRTVAGAHNVKLTDHTKTFLMPILTSGTSGSIYQISGLCSFNYVKVDISFWLVHDSFHAQGPLTLLTPRYGPFSSHPLPRTTMTYTSRIWWTRRYWQYMGMRLSLVV